MDHLGTLNDDTPRIQVSRDKPVDPSVVFGLDTTLFLKKDQENVDWEQLGGGSGWHGDEVETKTIWKGGRKPGNTKKRKRVHGGHDHDQHDHTSGQSEHTHVHANGEDCHCHDHSHDDLDGEKEMDTSAEVEAIDGGKLEDALGRLNFEIYRGEPCLVELGLIRRSQGHCANCIEGGSRLGDTYPQLRVWSARTRPLPCAGRS